MLDFVPNHTALDHPWVQLDPEYYISGTQADLEREPHNYTRVSRAGGDVILAHGRDPVLSRLARHAATRLQQSHDPGGHARRAPEDRRSM